MHPDHLSQVCTIWRRTSLSCPSLWQHIDLSSSEPWPTRLFARAKRFAARAEGLAIELHIAECDYRGYYRTKAGYMSPLDFIWSIPNPVKSLQFDNINGFRPFHRSVLDSLLPSQDSSLTRLVMHSEYHNDTFIYARGHNPPSNETTKGLRLDLSQDEIESAFARLKTLDLQGIFPLWSSTAYHGLVDLRLALTSETSNIREIELITILNSSPSLRILHFGLGLQDLTPYTEQLHPVYLEDLQVIKILPCSILCPSDLLRLLAPGPKSIRLSVGTNYNPSTISVTELENFFARSRVAIFHSGIFPPLAVLLRHAARLERVIIDDVWTSKEKLEGLPPSWAEVTGLTSFPRLKSFHIMESTLYEDELRLFTERCPAGVVLYNCNIRRDAEVSAVSTEELSVAFPTVKVVNYLPYLSNPTEDWDILV